jgi:NAD(P)-dependent dehydrogenase (short-subunit alcohol dehydrogenase family)
MTIKTGTSERPDLSIAVIVGGGGMGMSTARRLGQHCRVVLASLSAEKNPQREAALKEDGIDAIAVQCDMTDPKSVENLASIVAERGPLRTLAHVAALSPGMGDWRTLLSVNLIGAKLIEEAMLGLAGQGTAAIFVSSLAGHSDTPPSQDVLDVLDNPLQDGFFEKLEALVPTHTSQVAYGLSKLALNRMCQRRAAAWGRKGARIVSMSPGMIATPMGALEFSGPNRELKLGLLARTPLGREGTMIETADAIEFLASDRASFITGTDLLVDGGAAATRRFPQG